MEGEVRFREGHSELDGPIEICYKQTWGTICDDNFDVAAATVVCKSLGFYVGGKEICH